MAVSRATLRANVLKLMEPGVDDYLSSTTSSGGTTTTLVDSTLKSFRRTKTFYQGKKILIPGAAAADQERKIQDFDPDNGTITVDRAYSGSSVTNNGTAYEIYPFFDLEAVHDAINRSLRRCEYVARAKLYGVSGSTLYNLSTATRNLIVNPLNKHIDFTEGGSALLATLTEGEYDADDLASEIDTQLEAAGANTFTVTFSRTTGKYTIAVASGQTLAIQWASGANVATSAATTLGFTADDSGAETYTSDAAVATNTWLTERRQIGRSRWRWQGGFGDILAPEQMGLYEISHQLEAYLPSRLWTSDQELWVPTLRTFATLTAEADTTECPEDWVEAGACRWLYLGLAKDESAGHGGQYVTFLRHWSNEWQAQCHLHQGALPTQTYGEPNH
jgi:hypothetical protein